jgi:hypothetical protein
LPRNASLKVDREDPDLANFLIVVPGVNARAAAENQFRRGIQMTRLLKSQQPSGIHESDFALVATFPRKNGSGTPVVVDPTTGNWLVAVGTWFHDAGYGSGQEEQLLRRFNEVGPDRLAREVEGFFAIVTGHAASREVTVIVDVVGTLHCYARTIEGAVAISASSLVLAALGDVTLDATACQEFLQTAAMYEDRTYFNEVRKLDASRCYCYANGSLQSRQRYWHATDLAPDSLDGEASVVAMREAMAGAARKIGAVFPRTVVDLTGGYDSRAGVAAFLDAKVPFRTAVAGLLDDPDILVSRRLADQLGLDHRHFQPGPVSSFAQLQQALELTDGECDLVDYARIYEVQSDLAARFDVSVNSYSGEIGRGYGWEVLMPNTGKRMPLDPSKAALRRFVNPTYDSSVVPPKIRMNPATHFRDVIARADEGLTDLPNTMQYDYCMTMMRCQRWYGRIASSTNQLWPCMSFFLLRSIIKPMLETNTRSRENSLLFRRVFLAIHPVLANEPLARGYPPLPVTWKTIHRFWPLIPLYGGKVLDRVRRKLLPRRASPGMSLDSPRMRLWQDPAVQHVLHPAQLLSTQVLDVRGVAHFLERSKQPEFEFPGQWSNLLSLEMTLQRLKAVKAEN